MEHRSGHIIPLAAVPGEFLDCREDVVQQFNWGFARMSPADIPESLQLKFLSLDIPRIGQSIGTKQYGIAGLKVLREFVVDYPAEEAWWDPCKFQGAAIFTPDKERAGHAGAHDAHLRTKRVKNGVLNRAVASRYAPEEQPLVQDGKDPGRGLAGLMHAAQRPNRQCGIERRRKSFPGYVAQVQADHAVGKEEVVQEIAPYLRCRLELMGNRHAVGAQRLSRQHDALDGTRFLELLFAQLLDRRRFGWLGENWHGFIWRGEFTGRGTASFSA